MPIDRATMPEAGLVTLNLTQAPLAAGERMEVDFRTLYAHAGVPVKITVTVTEMTEAFAKVRVVRENVR